MGSGVSAVAMATPLLLWSTNAQLKFYIHRLFYADVHYVWCSPFFDAATLSHYAVGAGMPPSSDPASIYRQLHKAVKTGDSGDSKIAQQKRSLKALALKAHAEGRISKSEADQIAGIVKKATFKDWRPLIYVIPYANVAGRARLVDIKRRAGIDPEYVVADLRTSEFDLIEPVPCP